MKFLMIPNIGVDPEIISPAKLIKILTFWTHITKQTIYYILVFNILLLGQLFIDENYGHTFLQARDH